MSSVHRLSRRPVGIAYLDQVITVFILYSVLHCVYVICSQVVKDANWYCIPWSGDYSVYTVQYVILCLCHLFTSCQGDQSAPADAQWLCTQLASNHDSLTCVLLFFLKRNIFCYRSDICEVIVV